MAMTTDPSPALDAQYDDRPANAVFLDLDTILLAMHPGRRGLELGLQADLPDAIERLEQVTEKIIVLVEPTPLEGGNGRETERRLEVLREGLGPLVDRLLFAQCPHGEDGTCACSKPRCGLVELAVTEHNVVARDSWHIGADAEGVQAGRGAGLRTIRVGPVAADHLSNVHRADHEARDLLDAANWILLEALPVP